jgi:multimeric flavodoxin WrbA
VGGLVGKKILILNGSPNENGRTMTLVRWVADAAREAGAHVEIVDTARLECKVPGCIACMGCRESDEYRCVFDDDARDVIARIPSQDVVAFATPVYFMGFPAQIKRVIDRMFSLFKYDDDRGRTYAPGLRETAFALIATAGGDEDDGLGLVLENAEAIASFMGSGLRRLLVPNARSERGVNAGNAELKERARDFGRDLAR